MCLMGYCLGYREPNRVTGTWALLAPVQLQAAIEEVEMDGGEDGRGWGTHPLVRGSCRGLGGSGRSLGQGGGPASLPLFLQDQGRPLGCKPGFSLSLPLGKRQGQALKEEGQDHQGDPRPLPTHQFPPLHLAPYAGTSTIWKASMMSPSWKSSNPSRPIPHS